MLVALTAAVVAIVGGITVATATADQSGSASRISSSAKSGEVTGKAAKVAGAARAADAEAAIPTQVVWTRRSTWVNYGDYAILEGQVQEAGGAVPGVTVKLYGRSSTSKPWGFITSTTTNSSTGLFRFDRKPPQNFYYAAVFPGNATYTKSTGYAKVKVRRDLTPAHMTDAPNNKFYYYGPVRPTYKYKTVKLQIKTCGTCSWQSFSSTKTNSKSAWKFLLTGPTRPNREYFYRAYTPSTDYFLAGYADIWSIRT